MNFDEFGQQIEVLRERVAVLLQRTYSGPISQLKLPPEAEDELGTALEELKVASSALRSSNERFRLVVENVQDYAIFTTDSNGYIDSWNLGVERILGYSEAEIVGQHASCIFTPEDRKEGEDKKEFGTAVAEGRASDERWHVRKDGTRFWASTLR